MRKCGWTDRNQKMNCAASAWGGTEKRGKLPPCMRRQPAELSGFEIRCMTVVRAS